MNQASQRALPAGSAIMLISAAIFGYFGFATTFVPHSAITGQLLVYVPVLEWTLKVSAIAFLIAGIASFAAPLAGNLLYAIVGLLGAIAFVFVAIMDVLDRQHMVMSPLLLFIFAAWNGYGSWTGLRAIAALRSGGTQHDLQDERMP